MTRIEPRVTRRELQSLIRNRAWSRLARRLRSAHPADISAQLPGLGACAAETFEAKRMQSPLSASIGERA